MAAAVVAKLFPKIDHLFLDDAVHAIGAEHHSLK